MFPNNYITAFKIKTEENDGMLKELSILVSAQLNTLEYLKKENGSIKR